MAAKADVVIVSGFGRGHWLAYELVEQGFKVVLIDVTESLGRWAPEDWEGPFGFFQAEKLSTNQLARLSQEDYSDEVDDGFVVWSKEGPIDFKGVLSNYWMTHGEVLDKVRNYLVRFEGAKSKKDFRELQEEVFSLGFKGNWMIQLAHQLASNVFIENAQACLYGEPLPLFAPYLVRRASRRGFQKSLQWCRDKGVEVLAQAKIKDFSMVAGQWNGLEVQSEWSGVLNGHNLVWSLSSQETQRINPEVAQQIYPSGVLAPDWVWIRYRVGLNLGIYKKTLPIKFVLIMDRELTWTHENLLLIQQTVKEEVYDVWLRIPAHSRFQRSYLEGVGVKVVESLKKKIPESEPQIQDMPQDYLYDISELGVSPFPVYSHSKLKKFKSVKLKNLHFLGPETGSRLDWTGRFEQQVKVLGQLNQWKQSLKPKLEVSGDQSLHP